MMIHLRERERALLNMYKELLFIKSKGNKGATKLEQKLQVHGFF